MIFTLWYSIYIYREDRTRTKAHIISIADLKPFTVKEMMKICISVYHRSLMPRDKTKWRRDRLLNSWRWHHPWPEWKRLDFQSCKTLQYLITILQASGSSASIMTWLITGYFICQSWTSWWHKSNMYKLHCEHFKLFNQGSLRLLWWKECLLEVPRTLP